MSDAPSKRNIDGCRRCELWEHATQGVTGEGPTDARLMLVGEQPGDEEDQQGLPFVGPAGRLLDEALAAAGIDRAAAYVTNAVKHFKWKPDERRGKRRIGRPFGPSWRQRRRSGGGLEQVAGGAGHVHPPVGGDGADVGDQPHDG